MTYRKEFRLDQETLDDLQWLIERYRDDQSHVIRLAIKEFKLKAQREGKEG